jgi:hypothetical protein
MTKVQGRAEGSPEEYPQDVNDPIWHEYMPGYAVPDTSVRTTRGPHGALDLLHAVEDEYIEWVDRESDKAEAHKHPESKPKHPPVCVSEVGRDSWRGNTFTAMPNGTKIVSERAGDRSRVVVTNLTANVVYLSHQQSSINAALLAAPEPNMVTLVANGSREFRHQGEVYAYASQAGGQLVDVQDEYGSPEY